MVCSPVSCTINGYQHISVGEKALQCVWGWEQGADLGKTSQATQVFAERLCFRAATCVPRQWRALSALLDVPLDNKFPGGRVRVTAFKRLSQGGLTPKAQRGKEQPSACDRHQHAGMLRCAQEDQQAWPSPVPTASSSNFQMRAGSQGGPNTSHPTPPSLPVCSFLSWGDFISSFPWQQLHGNFTLPTAAGSKWLYTLKQFLLQATPWNESEQLSCCQYRGAEFLPVAGAWVCPNPIDLIRRWLNVWFGVWGKAVKGTQENGDLKSGDLVVNYELLCFYC